MTTRAIYIAGLALLAASLAGCSGVRPYKNEGPANLEVKSRTESGSSFTDLIAFIDILKVKQDCALDYAGTVDLKSGANKVALPVGEKLLLVFGFQSESFWSNQKSTVSKKTTLTPRAGTSYYVDMQYVSNQYQINLAESNGGKRRPLDMNPLDCTGKR